MRFNPAEYSVKEGVDSNVVITLEALEDHPDFAFTVTVVTQNGTAIREFTLTKALCTSLSVHFLFVMLPFAHSTQVALTMKVNVSQ